MRRELTQIAVPFHRAAIGEEEVQTVAEVIRSGWLTMGEKTLEFEREFAHYVGAKYAVAVSSCTAALHLSLDVAGIHNGDEVLVPTTTFTATAQAVAHCGARPVLVDVDPRSLNISVADARRKINSRTKAVVPMHFGGQPCDMDEIDELAQRNNLRVIEDAAHALPSSYRSTRIGTISELTAFSFYATKTLSTGEGGMVTTSNREYAQRLQRMRQHGIDRDAWRRRNTEASWYYEVLDAGYKYNFTDLQAALGVVQLRKCDSMWGARSRIAERYNHAFGRSEALQIPEIIGDRTTSWHIYPLRLQPGYMRINRDEFISQLNKTGVGTSVHFIPLHLHPYYQQQYGYKTGDFPVAEAEYQRCLSLPIFPTMSDEEVDGVISAVVDLTIRFKR